jgi:hypothetical protein
VFKRLLAVASVSVIAVLSSHLPVHADDDSNWATVDYDYASRQLDNFIDDHERDLVGPVVKSVRAKSPSGAPTPSAAPTKKTTIKYKTTVTVRTPTVPRLMAAAYPVASRAEAEKVFTDLLTGYAQIEKSFGIPKRDVAGATAAFLAGSFMGYNNADFPDANFVPLVNQIRAGLAGSADFGKSSVKSRQDTYEQMAILGMFMANAQISLKQTPNPELEATMRSTAGQYLRDFLGVDPSSIELNASGLVIR